MEHKLQNELVRAVSFVDSVTRASFASCPIIIEILNNKLFANFIFHSLDARVMSRNRIEIKSVYVDLHIFK